MIYTMSGRTLMIEFKCGRCGKTHLEEASIQNKFAGSWSTPVLEYEPPVDWLDKGTHNPLLCPECAKQYKTFLANKGDVK